MADRSASMAELKALRVPSGLFHKPAKNLPEPRDEGAAINPLALSLQPEKGEEALERLPGVEEMDIEARGAVPATYRGFGWG